MSTSVSPQARQVWRATRTPVLIVLAVCAAGIVLALARGSAGPELDPGSAAPDGGRALARLLERQGVSVDARFTSERLDTNGATLLVTQPDLVSAGTLRRLAANAARVVLIAPDRDSLDATGPDMSVAGRLETRTRGPQCGLSDAAAAGAATLGGTAYRGQTTCYDGALARTGAVTVLGGARPLTNDALGDEGNAALTMRLLGERERLVWYVPSPGDPGLAGDRESLTDLLPASWVFGAAQVAVAVVLLALWRARRLGPVVTEPLPVVVRGAETVEGRARLYRRAGAAGHAAEALRAASLERLRRSLGLSATAEPEAVLAAVSARTGRDAHALLYGPPPEGDVELVRLADALDALENEVR